MNFNQNATGDSVAALLYGWVAGGSRTETFLIRSRANAMGMYLQDDWKISPNLSVNLGLRWDFDTPRFEAIDNRQNSFDVSANNPACNCPGLITWSGRDARGGSKYAHNFVYGNIGPPRRDLVPCLGRLGDPRRGLHRLHGPVRPGDSDRHERGLLDPGLVRHSPADGRSFPAAQRPAGNRRADRGGPGSRIRGRGNRGRRRASRRSSSSRRTARTRTCSRTTSTCSACCPRTCCSRSATCRPSARSSRSRARQPRTRSIRPRSGWSTARGIAPQVLRPFPQFSNVVMISPTFGDSEYHGVNFKLEKRYSNGLQFQTNYTWAKGDGQRRGPQRAGRRGRQRAFRRPVQPAHRLVGRR